MSITNRQALLRLMDKCDIYFEDCLISKERIVQKYAEFFAASFDGQVHSLSVAQHTGSVCFDVMSFLITALGCLALNETDNEYVIRSFEDGQYVLLRGKERCIWRGFFVRNTCGDFELSDFENAQYIMLEQPDKQHIKNYLPRSQWNGITPYNGSSTRTDGRGIRKSKSNRNDLISYLFGVPIAEIPSVIGVSTIIVTDRDAFKRIADGLRVEYGEGKSIGLLDLVTASYYTSNLEEHQYGANPAKTEPILKIVSKISAARDLVLDKSGNKTVGFMLAGTGSVASDNSELTELLERKSLKFSVMTSTVDSDVAQEVIKAQEEASIFVCTKEFLLQNSELPKESNALTIELDSQIENIVNNKVSIESVESAFTWQEIKDLKTALYTIRCSDIRGEDKDNFIITAHALVNTALTAVFPLDRLNNAFDRGGFALRATAPAAKLNELWELAERPTELHEHFITAAMVVEHLYKSVLTECPKHTALIDLLDKYYGKKVAVIVPKTYYVDILADDDVINRDNIVITTANRFNALEQYDTIIVAGDIIGTRFNPLKCRAASDIIVLLYDGETRFFMHKKREADAYEKSVNTRLKIETEADNEGEDGDGNDFEADDIASIVAADIDLESYINTITSFDIFSFAGKVSAYSGNVPTTEVYAVGHFATGERIFFTRYYQAVVFDGNSGTITEKDVESLNAGDTLVFAKRDDNTKNMVDYIYEQLQTAGRLSAKVIDATEKASYWKLALREYKDNHNLPYRDLANRLRGFGLSIQEVSVRQWLIEESHIVGPREENTLVQIANLTQDPFLLEDTHAYFSACEIVRKQRKNILKLIGKAITDKLIGLVPTDDKLLIFISENVDNLSESLDLDEIFVPDKPVSLPATLTNRPINETEVTL